MKDQKTAAQLAQMSDARMTLQATVSIRGQGSKSIAGAHVVGFGRSAFANRQAKEIADDLRLKYDLMSLTDGAPDANQS